MHLPASIGLMRRATVASECPTRQPSICSSDVPSLVESLNMPSWSEKSLKMRTTQNTLNLKRSLKNWDENNCDKSDLEEQLNSMNYLFRFVWFIWLRFVWFIWATFLDAPCGDCSCWLTGLAKPLLWRHCFNVWRTGRPASRQSENAEIIEVRNVRPTLYVTMKKLPSLYSDSYWSSSLMRILATLVLGRSGWGRMMKSIHFCLSEFIFLISSRC